MKNTDKQQSHAKTAEQKQQDSAPVIIEHPTNSNDKHARQLYWAKFYSLLLFLKYETKKKQRQKYNTNPLFMDQGWKASPQKAARRYCILSNLSYMRE